MIILFKILFVLSAVILFVFLRFRKGKPKKVLPEPAEIPKSKPMVIKEKTPSFLDMLPVYSGNPEYYPRKHTVMNYGTQRRMAKNRKAQYRKQPK